MLKINHMKKFITLIFGITLFNSCSTSPNENSNMPTIVVPVAPSNLIGTVASSTQINLSWTDNSSNETGFKIERKTESGAYTLVATTAANATFYNGTGLIPDTTYTYRIYATNAGGDSLTYSNEITLLTTVLPVAPSNLIGSIVPFTNQINLSWADKSTNEIGFKIERKIGTGSYAVIGSTATNISTFSDIGLALSTTYSYRVYSYNLLGNSTTYSNEFTITSDNPTVTDIDGNSYQTVNICDQFWTKTNLNVSKYRNGDIIPQVTDIATWNGLTTGAWCYYNNDSTNGTTYGKLYNWYAVVDPRGLAPSGYHISTIAELTTLTTCSERMRFTGLLGGQRRGNEFVKMGEYGIWWNSSNFSGQNVCILSSLNISAYFLAQIPEQWTGNSVRCVKD